MGKKFCTHCKKINNLYNKRTEYKTHTNDTCPLLKKTICLNCKKTGHTTKYCKVPQSTCILCCKIGHREENCGYISQILLSGTEPFYNEKNLTKKIKIIDWLNLKE